MDNFKLWANRIIAFILGGIICMPIGALIMDHRMKEQIVSHQQEITIKMKNFEYLESKAWKNLIRMIQNEGWEMEKITIMTKKMSLDAPE